MRATSRHRRHRARAYQRPRRPHVFDPARDGGHPPSWRRTSPVASCRACSPATAGGAASSAPSAPTSLTHLLKSGPAAPDFYAYDVNALPTPVTRFAARGPRAAAVHLDGADRGAARDGRPTGRCADIRGIRTLSRAELSGAALQPESKRSPMRVKEGEERKLSPASCRASPMSPPTAWDACANPDPAPFNPFIAHAFLTALEAVRLGRRAPTGWTPQHLALERRWRRRRRLRAAAISSRTARASTCSTTPGPTPTRRPAGAIIRSCRSPCRSRRCRARGCWRGQVRTRPRREACSPRRRCAWCERFGLVGAHITFLTEGEWQRLGQRGFLQRTDQQFHWRNEGYATFEDFLGSLASRKRKAMRKEREQALSGDLTIEWVTGRDIKEAHWDAFFAFYMDTGSRKWGRPYLNRRVLLAARRGHARALPAGHGQARHAARSPARST